MPTQQETFDTVARHLLTQKETAMLGLACAYRGHSGRKCAVGCLIPDERYDESIEGHVVGEMPIDALLSDLGHDTGLCMILQRVHDTHSPEEWHHSLRGVARDHELSDAVLQEFAP